MLTMLKDWKGTVEINGSEYTDIASAISRFKATETSTHIILRPVRNTQVNDAGSNVKSAQEYRITVKQYMTKKASPEFDFMEKYNHNIPMPLRTMIGTVERETRGMVYMKLHGDIYADVICNCMKCGRVITNKVSQYFGMGPECGGHNYVNPFSSEEELKQAVSSYKKQLQSITWEGWVIKSSILESEEL